MTHPLQDRTPEPALCSKCGHAAHTEKCRHWYAYPSSYSCDCEHGVRTIYVMHAEAVNEAAKLRAEVKSLRASLSSSQEDSKRLKGELAYANAVLATHDFGWVYDSDEDSWYDGTVIDARGHPFVCLGENLVAHVASLQAPPELTALFSPLLEPTEP